MAQQAATRALCVASEAIQIYVSTLMHLTPLARTMTLAPRNQALLQTQG